MVTEMRTVITEVFFRNVHVGNVISQAVLSDVVHSPFNYRPGYRTITRPNLPLGRVKATLARKRKALSRVTERIVLSPQHRLELEERLRMLEREYMQRVLATIQEFECRSGDGKYNGSEKRNQK